MKVSPLALAKHLRRLSQGDDACIALNSDRWRPIERGTQPHWRTTNTGIFQMSAAGPRRGSVAAGGRVLPLHQAAYHISTQTGSVGTLRNDLHRCIVVFEGAAHYGMGDMHQRSIHADDAFDDNEATDESGDPRDLPFQSAVAKHARKDMTRRRVHRRARLSAYPVDKPGRQ